MIPSVTSRPSPKESEEFPNELSDAPKLGALGPIPPKTRPLSTPAKSFM